MGLDTPFAPGGEEIGNRIGARFYYLDVDSPKRGHCSITLVPIVPAEGEEYPYTVAYMRMLEKPSGGILRCGCGATNAGAYSVRKPTQMKTTKLLNNDNNRS